MQRRKTFVLKAEKKSAGIDYGGGDGYCHEDAEQFETNADTMREKIVYLQGLGYWENEHKTRRDY